MSSVPDRAEASLEDQFILKIAKLMEGGEDDAATCKTLDSVTSFLNQESTQKTSKPFRELIDYDAFETILGYLDMRQGPEIRGHATLTVSQFMKCSEQNGTQYLHEFFNSRVAKGTYDDLIVAFSVAASIFPVAPSVSAELFLTDGFVGSLDNLMKRKWKSKKVEQACLEMLNAACMDANCREAIEKYCTEWLEEIVEQGPKIAADVGSSDRGTVEEDGPLQQRVHSDKVKTMAAVILAKLQVVPSSKHPSERIEAATMSLSDLSDMFAGALNITDRDSISASIEGLAYASLQPDVKEKLVSKSDFLPRLVAVLRTSPAKSTETYGGLSILINLTNYLPSLTEEQKRMAQLKAFASASQTSQAENALNDDAHVARRCKAVFDAGIIPVLVTHCQHGSSASLDLAVGVVLAIARTPKLRGQIAQQGGIKLLLHAYSTFPTSNARSQHRAAHALALILITTNPSHVFGGSTPVPLMSAIRPLVSLLSDDPVRQSATMLPTFEGLLALTNLASTDDAARNQIINLSWSILDELLLSDNELVARATMELICNLMQSPEGVVKFADGSKQAKQRMHILLALADAQDLKMRLAVGGALASLTEWDPAVKTILECERGTKILLQLCIEEDEGLRHRGTVCVSNVVSAPGDIGKRGSRKVRQDDGVDILKESLKKSRSQEVVEITVATLKQLLTES